MEQRNVIAVDLAKATFQVMNLHQGKQISSDKTLNARRLQEYLARQKPSIVAMESCGGAQHWARVARHYGHEVRLLPPKHVTPFRKGHKTDSNDTLAIAIACQQPKVKCVGIMTLEQQSLQSDKRVQEHLSDQLTATGNLLRSLVAEFGIVIPKGLASLRSRFPDILADAENGLPVAARESLHQAWQLWQHQAQALKAMEKLLARRMRDVPTCRVLEKLEGVASKNAVGLYTAIGDGRQFKNGREAAACIGLTPQQHSTGGKVKIGSIGKYRGNQRLRASLITGAHAVVKVLAKRVARNDKERWLKNLIARRGPNVAAVALANKTVRTAWAMLYYQTAYQPAAEC
jgi:transposase